MQLSMICQRVHIFFAVFLNWELCQGGGRFSKPYLLGHQSKWKLRRVSFGDVSTHTRHFVTALISASTWGFIRQMLELFAASHPNHLVTCRPECYKYADQNRSVTGCRLGVNK